MFFSFYLGAHALVGLVGSMGGEVRVAAIEWILYVSVDSWCMCVCVRCS